MNDCLFCKIVNGIIPANKVLENDDFLAFRDISPQAPVHVLVIPKKHFEDISELSLKDLELSAGLMKTATEVAKVENLEAGFRIVLNTGEDGGQTVQHVHAHVLGGRVLTWPPG